MARITYAEIRHKLVDPTAKADGTYTLDDKLPASSYAQIQDDDYTVDPIGTFEPDGWPLDGSRLIPAPALRWGLWTSSRTDANGDFVTNPTLTREFEDLHTSNGITFTFAGTTWPKQLLINWYQGAVLLDSATFNVDALTYFANNLVENYNLVTIEIIGTQLRGRRVKIAEVDYGQIKVWGRGHLIKATLLENVDPTSSELAADELSLQVQDADSEFNILNPQGIYASLREDQELELTEYLNGTPAKTKKLYLKDWKSTSNTTADFKAYGAVRLFDGKDYRDSAMWAGTPAGDVFAAIFAAAGWTAYTIDPDIAAELIYGYIPIISVRNALQQVCFILRAACIPQQDGSLRVTRLPSSDDAKVIDLDRKIGKTEPRQRELVNSVAVTTYRFAIASSATEFFSDTLDAGTYEIEFTEPAGELSVTGAAITASSVNYAVITVAASGAVTLTGKLYTAQAQKIVHEATGLTTATRSQAVVKEVYLAHPNNAAALAESLFNDYQKRIILGFNLVVIDEMPGDNADVETQLGVRHEGIITRMETDLTGGYTSKVEVTG